MIALGNAALKIFVALEPCDMRKSFNGLFVLASAHLEHQRLECDTVFVFTNKRYNRIKLLYFDGTGLWVVAKRPKKCRFSWPNASTCGQQKIKLKSEALQMLLDGVDLHGVSFKPWYERS